jgi:hypothetical protein
MNRGIMSLSAVFFLAGCAHLEQAPLVYTSKTSFGIEVSTTSTESPGVNMTVGFKQLDAAYVPVAVARKCGSEKSGITKIEVELCMERTFHEIRMISGNSTELGLSPSESASESEALMSELNQKISSRESAMKEVDAKRDVFRAAEMALSDLEKRKAQFDKNEIEIRGLNEEINSAVSAEDEKIARRDRLAAENAGFSSLGGNANAFAEEKKKRETQLSDASQALMVSEKKYNDAQVEVEGVVKKMRTSRKDAYSVFGSFDSKGGADDDSASFQLGKIFATGVASQNISDGLSDMYKNRENSAQECFQVISGALKGADQEAAKKIRESLKEMLEICGRQ